MTMQGAPLPVPAAVPPPTSYQAGPHPVVAPNSQSKIFRAATSRRKKNELQTFVNRLFLNNGLLLAEDESIRTTDLSSLQSATQSAMLPSV